MQKWEELDKQKKEDELFKKRMERKDRESLKLLSRIEEDYQNYKKNKLANPIESTREFITKEKPHKRFMIYRKVFVNSEQGLPYYNDKPTGNVIAEDILEVEDLYNEYFMNGLFGIESQMYHYVPYKIFDNKESKYVKNINVEGVIEYEN
jgi:hypothetical protein